MAQIVIGTVLLEARKPKKCPMTPLAPHSKIMWPTFTSGPGGRTRNECWGAASKSGAWFYERTEEPGTPWVVIHLPTGDIWERFGTLADARRATFRHDAKID